MYLVINNKLVVSSIAAKVGTAFSKVFSMPMPDDGAEIAFVIIAVRGTSPLLTLTLEESNDEQTWLPNSSLPTFTPVIGFFQGFSVSLASKRYRLRWDYQVSSGDGVCIVAANVETAHG